jgi:transcriptional regulator with XRE-family HTH domain
MVIYGAQLRAARALVGLSQHDVADGAKVSVPTIKRMEAGDGPVRGSHVTVSAVVAVLEAAGVTFTNTNGEPGVKLRRKST